MYVSDSMCRFVLREGVEFPGAAVTGCEPPSDGHGNWTPVLWKVSKSLELLSHRDSPVPWSFNVELFCPVSCILSGYFLAEMPLEPGPSLIAAPFLESPSVKIIRGLSLKRISSVKIYVRLCRTPGAVAIHAHCKDPACHFQATELVLIQHRGSTCRL